MIATRRLACLVFGAICVTACSSSSNHSALAKVDASATCDKLIDCGETFTGGKDECVSAFNALLFTAACIDDLKKATCDDLNKNDSAAEQACFPKCTTPGTTSCAGADINECDDSSQSVVIDCAAACTANDQTYTGTCGKSYQGVTSDVDKCWCK